MGNKIKKILSLTGILAISLLSSCNNMNSEVKTDDQISNNEITTTQTENSIDNILPSNDEPVVVDENTDKNLIINEDMSFSVLHPLGSYNVEGIIKNKYAQISTVSGETLESSKVNLRYIFELDTTDRDLSKYDVKIVTQLKYSRSDYVVREFESNISTVYNGYYSDGNLITKENICFVVYTLTNIPFNYWDYDFDVNCVITSDDESDSSDAQNNVLSVLVEENNDIIHSDFTFEEENDECILTEFSTTNENVTIPDRKIVTETDSYNRTYSYYKQVTGIGDNLLKDNATIRNVIIPDGIKTIGANAFSGCTNLNKVIIPNSVTTVGNNAFDDCDSLNEIVVSKNITSIGKDAFEDKAYTIYYGGKNNEMRAVVSTAFSNENNVWYYKTYDENTIDSKGNHWYYKYQNVNEIVAKTYHEVTLYISKDEQSYKYVADNEAVSLDEYIELEDRYFIGWYINNELYDDEYKITSDIQIDAKWVYANVAQGEEMGYEIYDLQQLNIETIDLTRFNNYKRITSISSTKMDTALINNDTKTVILPDSINNISDNAFWGFKSIKNVYYNADIYSWLNIKFEGLYSNPSSCPSFESFYLKDGENYIKPTTIDISCFIIKIGDYQFFNMKQINNIILPRETKIIGNSAFGMYDDGNNNSNIENVYYDGDSYEKNEIRIVNGDYYEYNQNYQMILHNRLSTETNWYFSKKTDELVFPGDYWWFENDNIVTNTYYEIIIHDGNEDHSYIRALNSNFNIEFDSYDFEGLYYDEEFNQKYTPSNITSSLELYVRRTSGNVNLTLSDNGYYYIVSGIDSNATEVIIPEKYNDKSVEKIAANAFENNTNITSIKLSNNINEIGADAFKGCTKLERVYWNKSFSEWVGINFNNEYSNPMMLANEFDILYKDSDIDSYIYIPLEVALISNNTDSTYPTTTSIKNYSLIGFDNLIFENTNVGIHENAFIGSSIEKIYLSNYNIKNDGAYWFYKNLKEKTNGTSIKIYRYIEDFSTIENILYIGNYYSIYDYNDCSGYWFNFSNNNDINNYDFNNQNINIIKYYKVIIDNQLQFVKEGSCIRDIEIPDDRLLVRYFQIIDDSQITFDPNTPITSDYELFVELTTKPDYNPLEEYRVIFEDYYQNGIHVNSKEIRIKSGEKINLDDLSGENYEIENIYNSYNYQDNELFDLNTPITSDITLYPTYTVKLNCGLVYDQMNNRYAYTVYLNYSNDNSGDATIENLIIPNTYKGLPVISISLAPNIYTAPNEAHYQNIVISDGIREINAGAFKYVTVDNLVLPTSLRYIKMDAFNKFENNATYDEFNKPNKNVYYEGKFSDWVKIKFENEYSNPIYLSKNLYLNKYFGSHDYNNDISAFNNYDNWYELLTNINTEIIMENNFNYDNSIKIGKYQFINLESLTSIDLSQFNRHIEIEEAAFKGCSNLTNIIFNNDYGSGVDIKKYAFSECMLIEKLQFDSHMTVDSYAFNNCHINTLIICINNEYIIKSNAFNECTIQKVYFKNNTEWVINTYISSNNPELYNSEWYIYDKAPNVPGKYWYYNDFGDIEEYDCGKITIRFNYGIEDLQLVFNRNNYNHDDYNKDNLENLIRNHIGNYYTIDRLFRDSAYLETYFEFDYYNLDNEIIIYAKIVPNLTYELRGSGYYITGLNEWSNMNIPDYYDENHKEMILVIPDYYQSLPVVGIAERAFEGSNLRKVVLPNTITEICDYAFYNSHIHEIVLPNSLTSLGVGAFKNCRDLRRVYNRSLITEVSNEAFAIEDGYYNGYYDAIIEISDKVANIGKDAFKNNHARLVIYSNTVTFDEDAFDEDYCDTHEIFVYPSTFTSNIVNLSSRFRIFNYTSDYEEMRYGHWWYFNRFRGFDDMYYDIFTLINM